MKQEPAARALAKTKPDLAGNPRPFLRAGRMSEVHPRSGHCQKAMAALVFEATGDTRRRLKLRRQEAPSAGLERILWVRAGSEKRLDRTLGDSGDSKGVA